MPLHILIFFLKIVFGHWRSSQSQFSSSMIQFQPKSYRADPISAQVVNGLCITQNQQHNTEKTKKKKKDTTNNKKHRVSSAVAVAEYQWSFTSQWSSCFLAGHFSTTTLSFTEQLSPHHQNSTTKTTLVLSHSFPTSSEETRAGSWPSTTLPFPPHWGPTTLKSSWSKPWTIPS